MHGGPAWATPPHAGSVCILCDHCDGANAHCFCLSDGCFLCSTCDGVVHANKITQRHVRVQTCEAPTWALNEARSKNRVLSVPQHPPQHTCSPTSSTPAQSLHAPLPVWGTSPDTSGSLGAREPLHPVGSAGPMAGMHHHVHNPFAGSSAPAGLSLAQHVSQQQQQQQQCQRTGSLQSTNDGYGPAGGVAAGAYVLPGAYERLSSPGQGAEQRLGGLDGGGAASGYPPDMAACQQLPLLPQDLGSHMMSSMLHMQMPDMPDLPDLSDLADLVDDWPQQAPPAQQPQQLQQQQPATPPAGTGGGLAALLEEFRHGGSGGCDMSPLCNQQVRGGFDTGAPVHLHAPRQFQSRGSGFEAGAPAVAAAAAPPLERPGSSLLQQQLSQQAKAAAVAALPRLSLTMDDSFRQAQGHAAQQPAAVAAQQKRVVDDHRSLWSILHEAGGVAPRPDPTPQSLSMSLELQALRRASHGACYAGAAGGGRDVPHSAPADPFGLSATCGSMDPLMHDPMFGTSVAGSVPPSLLSRQPSVHSPTCASNVTGASLQRQLSHQPDSRNATAHGGSSFAQHLAMQHSAAGFQHQQQLQGGHVSGNGSPCAQSHGGGLSAALMHGGGSAGHGHGSPSLGAASSQLEPRPASRTSSGSRGLVLDLAMPAKGPGSLDNACSSLARTLLSSSLRQPGSQAELSFMDHDVRASSAPTAAHPQLQLLHHTATRAPSAAGHHHHHGLVTRIERPDGTFKELDPERAVHLHRYRVKRMQRLKAYAEGQKLIRYECRKVLADARPRVRGRFIKVNEASAAGGGGNAAANSGGGGPAASTAGAPAPSTDSEGPSAGGAEGSMGSLMAAGGSGSAAMQMEVDATLRRAMSAVDLQVTQAPVMLAQQQQQQQQQQQV